MAAPRPVNMPREPRRLADYAIENEAHRETAAWSVKALDTMRQERDEALDREETAAWSVKALDTMRQERDEALDREQTFCENAAEDVSEARESRASAREERDRTALREEHLAARLAAVSAAAREVLAAAKEADPLFSARLVAALARLGEEEEKE